MLVKSVISLLLNINPGEKNTGVSVLLSVILPRQSSKVAMPNLPAPPNLCTARASWDLTAGRTLSGGSRSLSSHPRNTQEATTHWTNLSCGAEIDFGLRPPAAPKN